ncbi:MAG: hypothetical protein BWY49_00633 [Candidatus Omnitrophica bacterium ADurb.Bin314]|jgi:hypothetical protein|nr:MAG: hypothetical protein BWY49_00633 [Candidatus Omnitrophica bacterium ADurb.Bin314]
MTSFARDWPVYFIVGGLVAFMIYVFIHSNRQDDPKQGSPDPRKKEG